MTIQISTSYGFCHNWTLKAYGKSFYLGQDVKFCSRVLGCDPSYIVNQIGSNDLSKETTKKKLAKFILDNLNLNRSNIKNLEPWQLCAE
jgi:hypothetical protein